MLLPGDDCQEVHEGPFDLRDDLSFTKNTDDAEEDHDSVKELEKKTDSIKTKH